VDLFIAGMIAAEVYEANLQRKLSLNLLWIPFVIFAINALVYFAFSIPGFFLVDYAATTANGISNSPFWIIWPTLQAIMWSSLLLVYLASGQSFPGARFVAEIGKYSYSMYVWHVLVIALIKKLAIGLSPYMLGVFVVLPITILLSCLSYHVIEKPFLSLRVRYVDREDLNTRLP
jgi:peptidoglycan/LPS O-acetylase OafA/YrhL